MRNLVSAGRCLLEQLERAGHTAFFVGGYVRDHFLNRPIHDLDVATSAKPEEVMALFERVIPTGIKHGTVTVLIGGVPIEVTTYRTESGYEDFRRPDSVTFVSSIEEDLARRDFTMNAMAMDARGKLVDPFGGLNDLRTNVIRAVGDPATRFQEDALRMLRALRFASQLSFSIEEDTLTAIASHASLIQHVAVERIYTEWNKLLMGAQPDVMLILLVQTGAASYLPGLSRVFQEAESAARITKLTAVPNCRRLSNWPSLALRWCALFLLTGMSSECTGIMRILRSEKKLIDECRNILELITHWRALALSPVTKEIIEENLMKALLLRPAEILLSAASLYDCYSAKDSMLAEKIKQLSSLMKIKNLGELALTGRDLQECLQRKPGSWISQTLLRLAVDVNKERVANSRELLLTHARMVANEYT
ncbi:CCA tRNA nucleotidyltransferase [Aneurinibacillus sp. Ricciae_BoGa-3]|uniref:CCA tRNA nucleotidyltransferase n=1 Tax=Aneurinibacillus sp. Ricciae_BoGa-3 TaxID=3022697 RepID=UPI0023423D21|nr:CCA tRNA nucleotidyltransferase [Aneurinibacillus sp. Ricciae_BoGa-3]WCK56107.1 CCA tRNA nucleotidyltransferase [Aneurinibacillus sp. Ricciae_BoGa-3]